MKTLSTVQKVQYFDNSGDPLSGGKVYTYSAGTTIGKVTYKDANAAAQNTNPVILDAAGRADIWYDQGLYKIKLTDSNDVELWTVDNVDGTGSNAESVSGVITTVTTIANLRSFDTSLVASDVMIVTGYTSEGDGGEGQFYWDANNNDTDDNGVVIKPTAVSGDGRWIRLLNGEDPTVCMFGAKGDAVTNDKASFEYADAYATAQGTNIIVPPGSFRLIGDPAVSKTMRLAPKAMLQWDSFNPAWSVVISSDDFTQHFYCPIGDEPTISDYIARPEHFGAFGDGSADDVDSIQQALTVSNHVVMSQDYKATEVLTISNNGQIINLESCVLTATTQASLFLLKGKNKIEIKGNTTSKLYHTGSGTPIGISIDNSSSSYGTENINIHDLDVVGFESGIKIAISDSYTTAPKNIKLENILLKSNTVGLEIDDVNGLSTSGLTFDDNTDNLKISHVHASAFSANFLNTVIESGTGGVYISITEAASPSSEKVNINFVNTEINMVDGPGFEVGAVTLQDGVSTINVDNINIANCKQNGIKIGNHAIQNKIRINDINLYDNCKETTNADWDSPAWDGSAEVPEGKANILVWGTSQSTDWDAYNSGIGLITGNIEINKIKIYQTTQPTLGFYAKIFGPTVGTKTAPLYNTTIDGIDTEGVSAVLWSWDLGTYSTNTARGVVVKNGRIQESGKYVDAYVELAGGTLYESSMQGKIIRAPIDGIAFTLPAPNTSYEQNWMIDPNSKVLEVKSATGHLIKSSNGIATNWKTNNGNIITITSTDASWYDCNMDAEWSPEPLVLNDGDSTLQTYYNNTVLSTESWTGTHILSLPTATGSGMKYTIVRRSSSIVNILPTSSDVIAGISPSAGKYIFSNGGYEDTITLVDVKANVWVAVSRGGSWVGQGESNEIVRGDKTFNNIACTSITPTVIYGVKGTCSVTGNTLTLGYNGNFYDSGSGSPSIYAIDGTYWSIGSIVSLYSSTPATYYHAYGGGNIRLTMPFPLGTPISDYPTVADMVYTVTGEVMQFIWDGSYWDQIGGPIRGRS